MSNPPKDMPEIVIPNAEPGMNFISVDFDLVMVNRANERLYGKSITALLGKKCYREFERREDPCPHCPGRLCLATGETHEVETMGRRDDGTRYYARIRAHPVVGPDNQPTGFIEVVEDITGDKLAESLARIETDLQVTLVGTKNMQKALREALDAATRVEGVEWGCIFSIDQETGGHYLVAQRQVPPDRLGLLATASHLESTGPAVDTEKGQPPLEVVPIIHKGERVAVLVMGTSTEREIAPASRAALRSLGAITANAISRIRAEQSRGDAVADLEAFISIAPVAAWVIDREGRVTMWNRAAENLLGWQAAEILGRTQPFGAAHLDPGQTTLACKDGSQVDVNFKIAPFRDIVGNSSATIVTAEDLSLQKRVQQLEQRLAGSDTTATTTAAPKPPDATGKGDSPTPRVLIIDSDQPWGLELAGILSDLGYGPTRCASMDETAGVLAGVGAEFLPFVLAVVDLVTPLGFSGLLQTAALRELGFKAPVAVTSDSDVRGYEQHGFAAVLKRPYQAEAVAKALRATLGAPN
jgi:PAS domain S-box-containing protein